jgi:pyrroline-5-carboxylate reductase
MKKLVILGAGTAGTMMLNKLNNVLDKNEWQITIVDQHETHYASAGISGHDHDAGRDLYACQFYEEAAGGQIIFT